MNRFVLMVMGLLLALVGCTSGDPNVQQLPAPPSSLGPTSATTEDVVLDVGHCWGGYLHKFGKTWALTKKQQFGWGGGMPQGFEGKGKVASLSDSKLLYVDASGQRLAFIPVDAPNAYTTEGRLCG